LVVLPEEWQMARILIADDDGRNLYLLESILKGYGYGVTSATNGAEALELARQSRPDLIISDIFMPVMDGFALCMEWKADERLKDTPFVFYTATYTDSKDEQFALSLGAERFLIKPQEPEALIEVVRQLLVADTCRSTEKPSADEGETLRQYNEVLFRKLEQKVVQLDKANADLREIPSAVFRASRVSLFDFLIVIGVSVLLAITFNISNPFAIPLIPERPDPVPSISASAAMEDNRQGQTLIVDAMPNNFYQKRHIKGAVNMPMALFDIVYLMNFSEEDKAKRIVVYGNTISRPYDQEIAGKLLLRGYSDVKVMDGGLNAWEAAGYPVEEQVSK
jgi:CheY-like chemotaxis protein/rhodanese-related sulfurtransferase